MDEIARGARPPADGWLVGGFIRNDMHADRHRRHRALDRLARAAGLSDVGRLRPRARLPLQRHRDACAGDHVAGIRAGCGFSLILSFLVFDRIGPVRTIGH
jgi:hypothetical protein